MKKKLILLAVSLLTSFAYSNNQTKFRNEIKVDNIVLYECSQSWTTTEKTPFGTIKRTVVAVGYGYSQYQACKLALQEAQQQSVALVKAVVKELSQP